MRGPGETDEEAVAVRRGPVRAGARAGSSPDSALAITLAAARAALPPGGKAAARLQAFMERRGLTTTGDRGVGANTASAPHLARLDARRAGSSPAATYQQALATPIAARRDRAPGTPPRWRFLGPRWIPRGQTYGDGPGATPPVAGRVAAIAVDPRDSKHILVGSAGGGVWETKNRGRTWSARTDSQPSLGIGALAFDPSDATHVFAGTGEGNSLEVPGQGLLRSTDGGTTWTLGAQATFAGDFFYRLIVDPQDGKALFAATAQGVSRSADRGLTWTQVRNGLCWDISLGRPSGPGGGRELFAACEDGLYRSLNDGATWSRAALPGQPADFVNVVGRMAVAHAPSDPGAVYVFAARENAVWLWRRSAAEGTFSQVQLPSLDPPGRGSPGYGISQSWYDWCVAVAPNDRDTVFLGAVDAFRGHRAASGKWSWEDISSRSGADSMHPDQHTAVFDPSDPQVLYFGNDGGIFRSPDAGASWQSLNKGLGITEFEYLTQHPQQRTWILGGTQDNGTLRNRGNGIWDQVALGDGGDCATEMSTPSTCYHSYYGMAIERSRSGGDTWDDVSPPVAQGYRALFYPPLEANGKTLAKAGVSAFISDDEGDTWSEVALPGGDLATAMTFASDTRLLVGSRHGGILRLDRTGAGWGPARPLGTPRGAYASDLLAQPPGRYWATYSSLSGGHVFVSVDSGTTWRDATGDLPDVPVSAIEADPKAPDTLWIATDIGVFRSTDLGTHWVPFGDGLPRALAVDLAFHAKLRLLRVGTRSRGVWEISVP